MIFQNWRKTIGWALMLLVSSCVEPYFPEVLEAPNNFLVVNGMININGTTTIQLIRTQNLTDDGEPAAETGATVMIEKENGESYRLVEAGNGDYVISNLNLDPTKRYRLYISTTDGNEYASDYVDAKQTPAIDDVSWKPVDNSIEFYINTQDPSNATRYYRWEFEETWHYRSAFYTDLIYKNDKVEFRTENDDPIYDCWRSNNSTTIELGTSIKLSQDVINNYKILTVPYSSEKLGIKYSVLVKQYALTKEAFEYWEILKKNTESLGTLFDPLPSQLTGNIRNITNPKEPVIGYIAASSMQEKRVFVDSKDLPQKWTLYTPVCSIDTLLLAEGDVRDYFTGGGVMPVKELLSSGMSVIGYTYAFKRCVDCRVKGTNVKPAFWE